MLPATPGILGANVDAPWASTLLKVPFPANLLFSQDHRLVRREDAEDRKTRAEIEKRLLGRLVNVVMKRPMAFAGAIRTILMTLLVIPVGQPAPAD